MHFWKRLPFNQPGFHVFFSVVFWLKWTQIFEFLLRILAHAFAKEKDDLVLLQRMNIYIYTYKYISGDFSVPWKSLCDCIGTLVFR